MKSLDRILNGRFVVVALIAAGLAQWSNENPTPAGNDSGSSRNSSAPNVRTPSTLIVLVPGTWANQESWSSLAPGMATFASEMQRAIQRDGGRGEVYPFLWASGNNHRTRTDAAWRLSELIDRRAVEFDRVCLVGHSHGGNLCLLAAAVTRRRFDAIVCLSTPHPHLQTRHHTGRSLELPVYCAPQAVKNTGRLLCLCPEGDQVPDVWADVLNGLNENDALQLVEPWQSLMEFPRLASDGAWFRLLGRGNLTCRSQLNVTGAENVSVPCLRRDPLGIAPHRALHSRRMGSVIGDFLRPGPRRSASEFLQLLLPDNTDLGEAIPQGQHDHALSLMAQQIRLAGWRLERVQVTLDEKALKIARDPDGSAPDLFLRIVNSVDGRVIRETTVLSNEQQPQFSIGMFCEQGRSLRLEALDSDFLRSTSLGSHSVVIGEQVPEVLTADHSASVHWDARLVWTRLHY